MQNLVIQFSLTFVLAAALGWLATKAARALALRLRIVDVPDQDRKIHTEPTPLLGGVALWVSFVVTIGLVHSLGWLTDTRVPDQLLWSLVLASGVLVFFGGLDDRFRLRWWQQLLGPIIAIAVMLAGGLSIPFVTSPFGQGLLNLESLRIGQFVFPLGSLLVFIWIMGMIYTTKLLDGINGLTSSVSLVASLVLFVVSLFWDRTGSTTSYLTLVVAGSALGFLFWNWYPAKIFLGEGGSTYFGFMLGVLAIISGGKIATALLVMGVPIIDVAWVIGMRLLSGKKIFVGDDSHLHFRLLRAGLHQKQVVLFIAFISLLFGSVSFFFKTQTKVISLGILILGMLVLEFTVTHFHEKNPTHR